jgi:hypothetical protein
MGREIRDNVFTEITEISDDFEDEDLDNNL